MDNSKLSRRERRRKKQSKEQTLPGRGGRLGKMCPDGADSLGNLMQRQLSAATIWGGDDTVGSLLRSVAAVRMMAACDLPMRIDDFEWTLERVDHIALHSVTPEEVEEVMSSAPVFKRGRGGVYESWGQTDSGRY